MYPKYNAGEKPELKHVLSIFSRELAKGRLTQHEFKKQQKRGIDVLTKYYAKRKNFFLTTDEVQVDMKSEGVVVGEALLSGKLDFLRMTDNKYHVVDFKTGRSYEEWDGPKQTDVDKVKLHKYRHQLVYYKVLLENSVHYKLPVETLALEFVESILDADEPILLYYMPTEEDVSRMKKLIEAVYKKIVNLDFPDISAYEQNIKGILQFEEDLIQGHISNIDKI
jgi:hypothetical protein